MQVIETKGGAVLVDEGTPIFESAVEAKLFKCWAEYHYSRTLDWRSPAKRDQMLREFKRGQKIAELDEVPDWIKGQLKLNDLRVARQVSSYGVVGSPIWHEPVGLADRLQLQTVLWHPDSELIAECVPPAVLEISGCEIEQAGEWHQCDFVAEIVPELMDWEAGKATYRVRMV